MIARRACLSVPAASPRAVAKAPSLPADEIVLDLEDAVTPEAKDAARDAALAALADPGWRRRTTSVRVNAVGTPWCHRDLVALGELAVPPASVVVPKVESPADLAFVDRLLDGVEAAAGRPGGGIRVQALIETAAGVAAVGEIAAASERLDALILGYADLATSLGRSSSVAGDLGAWAAVQDAVLVAARANGLQAIDGPWLGTTVDEGFLAAATRARDLGFDGKWAIHPSQLETLATLFTPSQGELARARAVLSAYDEAARRGQGVVALDGEMVDAAVAAAARRTLARAR